jgi:hypothetical protein
MALAVTCVATTTRSADATVAPDRASIAQAWVATRPPSLHVGPFDGFVAHAPITSVGWSYVPYDRTYQGLPVIGGDFVVVIDPSWPGAGCVGGSAAANHRHRGPGPRWR